MEDCRTCASVYILKYAEIGVSKAMENTWINESIK